MDSETTEILSIWQDLASPLAVEMGMWEFVIAMHKPRLNQYEAMKLFSAFSLIHRITTQHLEKRKNGAKT